MDASSLVITSTDKKFLARLIDWLDAQEAEKDSTFINFYQDIGEWRKGDEKDHA